MVVTGRCVCAAFGIELTGPRDFLSFCHGETCRRSHGATFMAWTSVPQERFRFLRGEDRVRWYASSKWLRGDSAMFAGAACCTAS